MKLTGAFNNFDFSKNPLAAVFIFSGDWEISLHSSRRPETRKGGYLFKDDILAKGIINFKKRPGRVEFYIDRTALPVLATGICRGFFVRQNGFLIIGSAGQSGSDLNLHSVALTKGNQLIIETLIVAL